MKFASFELNNTSSWGLIDDGEVIDLAHISSTLKSAIEQDLLPENPEQIGDASGRYKLEGLVLLPPIPDPQRVLCVGQNYAAHREEMQGTTTASPLIFTRYPSSLVGHAQPLLRPPESEEFDYEGELAVIIGKPGRRIEKSKALEHIAGYSCFMDGSLRDFQNHTTQYIPGKNFEKSGSFGPWMIPASAIGNPNAGLKLQTRLNGELVQATTTDLMIFDIPTIIAYLSTFTTLEPGDVIATGTPGGVGYKRSPQLFMKPGDLVDVEIENIAALSNPVSAD